ncbi:MAG TPA: hypothetical protein PKA64_20840 [Myxococcota bacterium]|nr:hypothetical protein [Myxococcota bacterium]
MISLLIWMSASSAGDTFSLSADVGGTARFVENVAHADPSGFGLELGARAELDALLQARIDVHYVEGKAFNPDEDRLFDLSAAISSPALLFLCADVQEIGFRESSRPGDDLFYLHAGLGAKGRLGVRLKASLGMTYLSADGVDAVDRPHAFGGYVGAELVARTRVIDATLRGTPFLAFRDSRVYAGVMADGDLTVKIPVGPVFLGPRLDVSYRNLGLNHRDDELFGQRQELTGHLSLAVHWGVGG